MKWTSPEVNRLFGSWTQQKEQGEREREREEEEMGGWRKGRTKGESLIHKGVEQTAERGVEEEERKRKGGGEEERNRERDKEW